MVIAKRKQKNRQKIVTTIIIIIHFINKNLILYKCVSFLLKIKIYRLFISINNNKVQTILLSVQANVRILSD